MDSLESNSHGNAALCHTEMLFSLQPYHVPVQSVRSFQWACAGWREESTWQLVCQSPVLKYFSWRRGEGGMRRLLTVPCRESTRGVFKGWSFRHVIMRQWHCSGHQTGPPAAFWFLPCHTLPSIAGKVPFQAAFVSCFITEFAYVLLTSWRNYLFWVADTELKAQPSSKAPESL